MGTNGVSESLTASKAWTQLDRRAILDQLDRMLVSPHFSHSKRYPTLLRYVVEQALAGHSDQIKERVLGIEVFGRASDYDTTQDPVVRMTAGEIRKRIAQYYHEPGHQDELRIELPSGTYVPEFYIPAEPLKSVAIAAPIVVPVVPETPAPRVSRRISSRKTFLLVAGVLAVAAVISAAWYKPWVTRSALDRFWAPVLESPNPALLCVGQPHFSAFPSGQALFPPVPVAAKPSAESDDAPDSAESQVSLHDLYRMGKLYISFWDSVTMTRIAALLEGKTKRYRLRPELATSLSDLRDGPAILVGAFNNDWTLRLTGPLRFSFLNSQPHIYAIQDQQNASQTWVVDTRIPYMRQSDDYAVISRVKDATTDRTIVAAGGVAYWGTIAAGEFLTDPKYMEEVAKTAPSGWEHKNMQIVIGTRVIAGNCGPPRVLATYFW